MATTKSDSITQDVQQVDFDFLPASVIPLWLDGKEITTDSTFDVVSPRTNKLLYKCTSASEYDVAKAMQSAEEAFKTWSKTKPAFRRDILLKAAEELGNRKEECFAYLQHETGAERPMFEFQHKVAIDSLKDIAGLIQTVQATMPTVSDEGSSAIVLREPYGVVLGIAPWNAPYANGLRACLQPLAAGNTVILKGPELLPGTYWIMSSVLHNAGLPAGCLNTLYHRPSDAAAITKSLIESPAVKKINFTGSTLVGCLIASQAGKAMKPVLMELGGKAPSIVCQDAKLELAAASCAMGAFQHGGQICMSTERVVVHKKVAKQFKSALLVAMEEAFGKDFTPTLIGKPAVEKNKNLLSDAISKGASVLYGDADHTCDNVASMQPVIIENVDPNMSIYYTESFGPTLSVYEVDSDEAAIKIANDTEYGLSSAIFTEDLRRGLNLAKKIETGAVHINGMTVHDETALPHGGAKKSGYGGFNGVEGLNEWLRLKTVTWKD